MILLPVALAQELSFERYTLPNGLHVVLHQDRSLPQIVVDTWYRVGSKDELPGRSGFAHLFEHLMFMGTDRLPGSGFDQVMEAEGGWNNAWTMEDATNYYDVGPPHLLETFLWMEADRMQALGAAMTQEKLDLQRDVVRNERRQTSEDRPYGIGELEMPGMMYPAGHPYAHTVIGTHEDLQAASLQDVKDFFATWYVPNNASLVVAGDFEVDAAKAAIERYFGAIPSRPLPARPAPAPVRAQQKALVTVPDQVDLPQITLLWHSPAGYTEGDAEANLAAKLLSEGESSRLYTKLVKAGLAQEVSAFQYSTQLGGVFVVQAIAAEGVTIDKVEATIRTEIAALAGTPPTAAEMERLRNQTEHGFLAGLEAIQERATKLNEYWAYTGTPDGLAADLARYRNATAEGLSRFVATWLQPQLAGALVVVPESAGPSSAPQGGAQ